ncbi:ACT domain containing protein [sediment metagenome]|uniref:ACT domain containing protein n=1 Tax=sediment metagenome TaxID=749907 RepID=D9PEZ9_9ZZZZ
MAKQLNVFLDNRPGRLNNLTEVLFKEKINIRAITLQDRQEFGLIKLLVDNPQKACASLKEKGFACAIKDIIAILMDDTPGGLNKLTEILSKNSVNIVDAYGFVIESSKQAVFCLEIKDPEKTKEILKKEGIKFFSDQELYEL